MHDDGIGILRWVEQVGGSGDWGGSTRCASGLWEDQLRSLGYRGGGKLNGEVLEFALRKTRMSTSSRLTVVL